MSKFNVTPKDGADYEKVNPATGMWQAILCEIVDLGTQKSELYGDKHQIWVNWEFTNQHHVFDEEKGPERLHIGRRVTLSLNSRAKLADIWLAMTQVPIKYDDDGEAVDLDIFEMLGMECNLNLVSTKKDGKEYINIGSITPLMANQENVGVDGVTIRKFVIADYVEEEFNNLHDWHKDIIRKSPEYQAAITNNPLT